jgi:hypothetical protein
LTDSATDLLKKAEQAATSQLLSSIANLSAQQLAALTKIFSFCYELQKACRSTSTMLANYEKAAEAFAGMTPTKSASNDLNSVKNLKLNIDKEQVLLCFLIFSARLSVRAFFF